MTRFLAALPPDRQAPLLEPRRCQVAMLEARREACCDVALLRLAPICGP